MTVDDYTSLSSPDDMTSVLTVSQITAQVKSVLDGTFQSVLVEGEISNFLHHSSGHMYFTLKDDKAELRAVMFQGDNSRLKFVPEGGMKVLVRGKVTVYEARGVYQIIIKEMETAGLGALYLAFEALKKKLASEGLFEEEKKRPLPPYPAIVGVITSGTGAALQDILNILSRRAPHVSIVVRPTLVQGKEATEDIVTAIQEFSQWGGADVLIVGRGGGSIEDLWCFNEESVARAITDCSVPVISAVGHETDFTISDFVADVRAPTPSAAAEIVSPSLDDLLAYLNEAERRIAEAVGRRIEIAWQKLDGLTARYGFQQPQNLVDEKFRYLNEVEKRIDQQIEFILSLQQSKFQGLNDRLFSASPKNILKRGYSILHTLPERQIMASVEKLKVGEEFGVIMSDGEVTAIPKEIHEK
ncbi:MAG: exodeoxyribonuclease VII large subunit [Candidatus Marinimicrobia bacterium]|nr:exodeoxyribonuclease VII large subunit [Candidatus Neomarinimicrobiota bacterium]